MSNNMKGKQRNNLKGMNWLGNEFSFLNLNLNINSNCEEN